MDTTVFGRRAEIREMLPKVIEKFRQWGATSPGNAISIEELDLPPEFKELMKGCLGPLGIFVKVNGKYYLSEKRLKEAKEQRSKQRFRGRIIIGNSSKT